jgi:hypothetical protein
MAQSPVQTSKEPVPQARLVLQDPRVWDEAQVPVLRLSRELGPASESGLDRDTAQQTWEVLQLKPEEIMAQRAQLREANGKAEAATKQLMTTRAELGQVQAKLQHLQDTRWQHPAVYAAGATLVGVGWLWLAERKNRLEAQAHAALLLSESHSVMESPQGPPSVFIDAQDPPLIAAQRVEQPVSAATPDLSSREALPASKAPKDLAPAPFEKTPPWWQRWGRKPPAKVAPSAGQALAATQRGAQTANLRADVYLYDGSAEADDLQTPLDDFYDPARANVELLSQTRIKPVSSEDAMGHLLEIRMAVQTLCALEQPLAAQELLVQHIDAVPNTCAWAYMEYLDLSAKLGLREAFETMRKRYRLQFNRLAPYWMEPNASVQSLESYERPLSDLCAVWSSQDRPKTLIATWLLGTLHSRRLFQLPAYHDLLDLYEMLEFYDDQSPSAQDFVPTVSLLDLDYEFAIEVKLDAQSADDALRAIPTVKTGDFAVDFNLTQSVTQAGDLSAFPSIPKNTSAG